MDMACHFENQRICYVCMPVKKLEMPALFKIRM